MRSGLSRGARRGELAKRERPDRDPARGWKPFRVENGNRNPRAGPVRSAPRERTRALLATSAPAVPRRRRLRDFAPDREWPPDRLGARGPPTTAPARAERRLRG